MSLVAGVDLGKTRCRVAISDGDARAWQAEGVGARGLADPGGVEAARDAVAQTLGRAVSEAGLAAGRIFEVVLVGAAGFEASGSLAPGLLAVLAEQLPARQVALTSDAVVSHAGAFGGGEGAMVAIGTGSVAVGIGPNGFSQVDGLGYWLGDDGSGAWIGRAGLRAALRARHGRGTDTALLQAAVDRYGDLAALPATLASGDTVAANTAAFARDVVACADEGDAIAADIVAAAAALLAESVAVAARESGAERVTVIGGLAGVPVLVDSWRQLLPPHLSVVLALGSALDGAVLLAERADLPHERQVSRVPGAGAGGRVRGAVEAATRGSVDP